MPRRTPAPGLRRWLTPSLARHTYLCRRDCYSHMHGGGCAQAHSCSNNNSIWLPRRLLLVRHGESEANVDRECYSTTPDWRIALTARGRAQAFDCGRRLRQIIHDEQLYIYYSPYARARQTLEEMRKSLSPAQVQGEREDERLREQEMGNYQPLSDMDAIWAARNAYGRMFYRFPAGESGADVGDRVSAFFDSLLRERVGLTVPNMNEDMLPSGDLEPMWMGLRDDTTEEEEESEESQGNTCASLNTTTTTCGKSTTNDELSEAHNEAEAGSTAPANTCPASPAAPEEDSGPLLNDHNVLIVSHGLLIRLFVSRWFHVPTEVLETMSNPPNCAIVVLERDATGRRLVMTDMSKRLFGSDPLLQMMRFDGEEDNPWYRERYLGIVHPDRYAQDRPQVDDDENHFSKSAAHNTSVGAPAPPRTLRDVTGTTLDDHGAHAQTRGEAIEEKERVEDAPPPPPSSSSPLSQTPPLV